MTKLLGHGIDYDHGYSFEMTSFEDECPWYFIHVSFQILFLSSVNQTLTEVY